MKTCTASICQVLKQVCIPPCRQIPLSNWPDFHRMHPDTSNETATMNGTEEKRGDRIADEKKRNRRLNSLSIGVTPMKQPL